MSINFEAERECIKQQRKELAIRSRDKENFLKNSMPLFIYRDEAERFYDAFLQHEAEEDNKAGGN